MVTSSHTRIQWPRKKLLLTLFLAFVVVPLHGRDFTYEYAGKTLIYTVLDENKKTCETKAGNLNGGPGNKVYGDIVIPAIAKDGEVEYTVTSIGSQSFRECTRISSVSIPTSVTSIGSKAFEACIGLTSVTIPASVTLIREGAFGWCSGLETATIEGSPQLDYRVFQYCKLSPLKIKRYECLGSQITGLEGLSTESFIVCKTSDINRIKNVFNGNVYSYEDRFTIKQPMVPLFCGVKFVPEDNPYYDGPEVTSAWVSVVEKKSAEAVLQKIEVDLNKEKLIKGLRPNTEYIISGTVFEEYYNVYDSNKFKTLYPTIKCDCSSTQTSITVKSVDADVDESITPKIYIKTSNGDKLYEGGNYTVKGLVPNNLKNIGYADYNGTPIWFYASTKAVSVSASVEEVSPTTVKLSGSYSAGGAKIQSFTWYEDGSKTIKIADTKDATISGLVPGSTHQFHLTIKGQGNWSASSSKIKVTLPSVKFKMLQPKCVSDSKAIIAAETNISDLESNIGFQWKKYGAPESLAPKEGYAVVRDGVIEGYISNLQSTSYYNVRAFFKDVDGKYYYSDWITFDPSDFSFFEPTVRTYSTEVIGDSHAILRGYVLPGTDDIVRQGFQYWVDSKTISRADAPEIFTVEAKGQMMMAEINNLKSGCEYIYRAFVETKSGFTYGEEQSFQTSGASGLDDISINNSELKIVGYYDVFGRRYDKPCRGVNIILYSDGTTKKKYIE